MSVPTSLKGGKIKKKRERTSDDSQKIMLFVVAEILSFLIFCDRLQCRTSDTSVESRYEKSRRRLHPRTHRSSDSLRHMSRSRFLTPIRELNLCRLD
ncbi:hypothetical protein EUGRSUZ_K03245 [Eucalyptus grandis]|uniref:Uncharacterized protein n=2 Tax=Eucalyptus grandis TaxID=71139 RepID=A0ACC3IYU4_EUCGR|nr:hypothetical protein EUGRSUZ_K03245 [Eucalyptus grandis]